MRSLTYFIISILICSFFLTALPRSTDAQFAVTDPGTYAAVSASAAVIVGAIAADTTTFFTKEYILDLLVRILARSLINALQAQIIGWITGNNGKNVGFAANLETELKDSLDASAGEIINKITGINFCGDINAYLKGWINIGIGGAGQVRPQLECTLTDILGNVQSSLKGFYSDFSNGGWDTFINVSLKPQNNPQGAFFITLDNILQKQARTGQSEQLNLTANAGFRGLITKDEQNCEVVAGTGDSGGTPETRCETSSRIVTPGRLAADQLEKTFGADLDYLNIADEIDEVITAIATTLISTLISGGKKGIFGSTDSASDDNAFVGWKGPENTVTKECPPPPDSDADICAALGYKLANGARNASEFCDDEPMKPGRYLWLCKNPNGGTCFIGTEPCGGTEKTSDTSAPPDSSILYTQTTDNSSTGQWVTLTQDVYVGAFGASWTNSRLCLDEKLPPPPPQTTTASPTGCIPTGTGVVDTSPIAIGGGGPSDGGGGPPIPGSGNFTPVGTPSESGIFSMEVFSNKLYSGTYDNVNTPTVYTWDNTTWGSVSQGEMDSNNESIYDMTGFGGALYAATENLRGTGGRIYRLEGGSWKNVYQGSDFENCYSILGYSGYIYATCRDYDCSSNDAGGACPSGNGNGQQWVTVIRSTDGSNWSTVKTFQDASTKGGFSVNNNALYFMRGNRDTDQTFIFKTTDPSSNTWLDSPIHTSNTPIGADKQFVWNNNIYSGSQGGIAMWNGSSISTVMTKPAGSADTSFFAGFASVGSTLYACETVGWRASSGNAALYKTTDGTNWTSVGTLSEPECWALVNYNNELYVGTRKEGGGGKVYKMQ